MVSAYSTNGKTTLPAPSRYGVKPATLTRWVPKFEPPNIAGTHNPHYPAAWSTRVSSCGKCTNRAEGCANPAPIPDKTVMNNAEAAKKGGSEEATPRLPVFPHRDPKTIPRLRHFAVRGHGFFIATIAWECGPSDSGGVRRAARREADLWRWQRDWPRRGAFCACRGWWWRHLCC